MTATERCDVCGVVEVQGDRWWRWLAGEEAHGFRRACRSCHDRVKAASERVLAATRRLSLEAAEELGRRLEQGAPPRKPFDGLDGGARAAEELGRRLERHPHAPDRCPDCEWTNTVLMNYGQVGASVWLCHGCAARRIQSAKEQETELADLRRYVFRQAEVPPRHAKTLGSVELDRSGRTNEDTERNLGKLIQERTDLQRRVAELEARIELHGIGVDLEKQPPSDPVGPPLSRTFAEVFNEWGRRMFGDDFPAIDEPSSTEGIAAERAEDPATRCGAMYRGPDGELDGFPCVREPGHDEPHEDENRDRWRERPKKFITPAPGEDVKIDTKPPDQ